MSKRFKTQDYFRYKKLGKRWRRPVGLQSKLRLKKGGSGLKVSIGYRTSQKALPTLIRNEKDFEKDCSSGAIFASSLGAKKTSLFAAKAKELGITVLNMKKIRRASKLTEQIKKKRAKEGKSKDQQKVGEGEKIIKADKKMGFHESVVPQVMKGKAKTYRLRDHNFQVGDKVAFENSQTGRIFGHGKITDIEITRVNKINLKDLQHYSTYKSMDELIAAFKGHHPERDVDPETEAFIYTYEFIPSKNAKE